jgi:hypothetical protein
LNPLFIAPNRAIKLALPDKITFSAVCRFPGLLEQSLYQAAKVWQPCRTRNTCAAEKHHATFLVRLQKRIRNVGAVGDELHSQRAF